MLAFFEFDDDDVDHGPNRLIDIDERQKKTSFTFIFIFTMVCSSSDFMTTQTSATAGASSIRRKVALITGITGQDGSYLTEFLLNKGYEVHGIIRRSSSFNTGRINHLYANPSLHKEGGEICD